MSENPGFLPGFRIFPDFYRTKLPGVISGFQKTKLYENPLRIVGGDSGHSNLAITLASSKATFEISKRARKHFHADFLKAIAALKMAKLKNEKHFIIIK